VSQKFWSSTQTKLKIGIWSPQVAVGE
jgi:hypothetical protein